MANEIVPKVSIAQVKAARALLGLSQQELASLSGVGISTIKRLESEDGDLGGRPGTSAAIVQTLIDAGARFDLATSTGPGVRLAR